MVPHDEGPGLQDGALEAAISTAMVQMLHRYTGRGPMRARTSIGEDVAVCVTTPTLTKGDQSLVDDDHGALVLRTREAYQDIMEAKAIASIEGLTGRTVTAFISSKPRVTAEPEVFTTERYMRDLREAAEAREAGAYADRRAAHPAAAATQEPRPGAVRKPTE